LSRRRGFWRLTFVLWLLVSAGMVVGTGLFASPSPFFPFRRIGADGDLRPDVSEACSDPLAEEKSAGLSLDAAFDRLKRLRCDAQLTRLAQWEATAVRAFRTQEYWASVRNAALVVACTTTAIWGLFYLAVWVAAGFRSES
jgi:hypothetical protein